METLACSILSDVDVVVASSSLSARAMQGARLSNNRRLQLPRLNRLRQPRTPLAQPFQLCEHVNCAGILV